MAIRAETSFSLKDQLFNAESVSELADGLERSHEPFRRQSFVDDVLAGFPERELKQRIDWMVEQLGSHLPENFEAALDVLRVALPPPLDPGKTDDDFGKFIWVVPGEYVARHGCTAEFLERSLEFLQASTQRFSAENAIRPFLRDFPEETLAFVMRCTADDHYHVRRLASEGIRPLLPWAERVTLPTADIIDVLDSLYADPTRYVTRSVANTLNDISKSAPDIVLETLTRWRASDRQSPAEMEWMTGHALRTLLKAGHPGAMELLGYSAEPAVTVADIETTDVVRLGEAFSWRCKLDSGARQKLKLALTVHYLKANGSHSAKTFAIRDLSVDRGQSVAVEKRVPFKPITTRVLYPGSHRAELVINGVTFAERSFQFDA